MNFDIPTAYLIAGVLHTLVPVIVWRMLAGQGLQTTAWWCGGGVLIGMSALWVALSQGAVSSYVQGAILQGLILGGILLKIRTLRAILSRACPWRWWWAVLLACLLLDALLVLVAPVAWRGLFMVISHIVFYAYLAWLAWRIHVDMHKRSVLWIFWTYVGVVLVLVALPLGSSFGDPHMWRFGAPGVLLVVLGIVVAFTNHLAYMGLVLENSGMGERLARETVSDLSRQSMFSRLLWLSEREHTLANVSRKLIHETNQSLTSLAATVALMQRAWRDQRWPELDVPELLGRMERSLGMAKGVVAQVHPLTRSKTGRMEVLDLREVIREALLLLEPHSAALQVQWASPPAGPLRVRASKIELMQVVVNLARNAAQACVSVGRPPRLTVDVHAERGQALAVFTDDGPGFSDEAMRRAGRDIFTTREQGMGLGLWISQEIMGRHGGELCFASLAGGGAEVTLCLPVAVGGAAGGRA